MRPRSRADILDRALNHSNVFARLVPRERSSSATIGRRGRQARARCDVCAMPLAICPSARAVPAAYALLRPAQVLVRFLQGGYSCRLMSGESHVLAHLTQGIRSRHFAEACPVAPRPPPALRKTLFSTLKGAITSARKPARARPPAEVEGPTQHVSPHFRPNGPCRQREAPTFLIEC